MSQPNSNVDLDDLEYELHLKPDEQPGLSAYVLTFAGEARGWDEALSQDRTLGEIRGRRVDLAAAIADGMPQGELLDMLTAEMSEFSDTVLHDEHCLLPPSEADSLQAEICECIVFIAELRIEPEYRGRGIGTQLLKRMAAMLDVEHCLIALKAFPLADEIGTAAAQAEIERVKRFYARYGFEPAGGDFMVKDARLCEAVKARLRRRRGD